MCVCLRGVRVRVSLCTSDTSTNPDSFRAAGSLFTGRRPCIVPVHKIDIKVNTSHKCDVMQLVGSSINLPHQ